MENKRAIYINTFAEGSHGSDPFVLEKNELSLAAHGWSRAKTIIHVHLIGITNTTVKGITKPYLIGDLGIAKVMLPVDREYSGIEANQDPMELTDRWICGMVESYDIKDEGNAFILINRVKGLERLRDLNKERVSKAGNRATGVIKGFRRGAYVLDVGGYTAFMPRYWYDWDDEKRNDGKLGEEFTVQIMPSSSTTQVIVSRRNAMPNPNTTTSLLLERRTMLRATVMYIRANVVMAEVYPGFQVSVDPINLREIPKQGDKVTVQVLGQNSRGYYGVMTELDSVGI